MYPYISPPFATGEAVRANLRFPYRLDTQKRARPRHGGAPPFGGTDRDGRGDRGARRPGAKGEARTRPRNGTASVMDTGTGAPVHAARGL